MSGALVRIHGIPTETLSGCTETLEQALRQLRDSPDEEETLVAALSFVVHYPRWLEWIGYDWKGDSLRYIAKTALDRVHSEAITVVSRHAERAGIDSGPMLEFGRECRRILAEKIPPVVDGSWPGCLGADLYCQPSYSQDVIRDGQAVISRLVARIEGADVARPPQPLPSVLNENEWVSEDKVVLFRGCSVDSLRLDRAPSRGGLTDESGLFGVDGRGRHWGKRTPHGTVYYLIETLISGDQCLTV